MSPYIISLIKLFNKIGIEIRRFPNADDRRLVHYLKKNKIATCIDVGANTGQFGERLFSIGFEGNIFSFEPQHKAYKKLQKRTSKNWKTFNYALGDFDGSSEMNISNNSVSSSLLDMRSQHSDAAPESVYTSKEQIEVKKLDSIFKELINADKVFLKIDTQGFEKKVLNGAENSIQYVHALQLEMACVELYEDELLFDEMKKQIEGLGFHLLSIESGFADFSSGKLLQIEAIFIR